VVNLNGAPLKWEAVDSDTVSVGDEKEIHEFSVESKDGGFVGRFDFGTKAEFRKVE
jgi:hypothetical protein